MTVHHTPGTFKNTLIALSASLLAFPAFGDWAENALFLQDQIDIKNTFNMTTWVGAHNAYANDEWGYFDPNQTLKPKNLLKAGARQLEYDPRKDDGGTLRLCHGDCSFWGGEKTFKDGLDQIKDFVQDNPNTVVFLKLEMDDALGKTADELKDKLENYIYRPAEGEISADATCSGRQGIEPEHLTKAEILEAGKNVIVFAGNGALDDCPSSGDFRSWVHVGVEYDSSGWQLKMDKPSSASDAATYYDQGRMTLIHDPNTFININGGGDDQIFTPGNVGNYMAKGQNVFELFNFNGDDTIMFDDVMADHMVWSWRTNEPSGNGDCAVVNSPVGGRFDDVPCSSSLRYACYDDGADDWNVTSGSGVWEDGAQTCTSEFGASYAFAVPTNGRQMDDLLSTAGGVSTGVFVNYHDLSSEGLWQANDMTQLTLAQRVTYGYPDEGSEFDHEYLVERGLLTGNLQKITSIRFRGGTRVQGIEVTYSGGLVYFEGKSSGDYSSALDLTSAQLANFKVCLDRHNGYDRLFYLEAISTAGSTISLGSAEGTCHSVNVTGDLFGIFGSEGNGHLKSLGFETGTAEVLGQAEGFEITAAYNTAKCMYKENSGWSNGNRLVIGDCGSDVSGGNRWTYEESTGYLRAVADPSKCIHKKDANWNNGNVIHVWNCSAGSTGTNKSWDYDASTGYISARENSSKCIHKKNADWDNGNPIHLWNCSAGSTGTNKSWYLD